jgi:TolB-like protein
MKWVCMILLTLCAVAAADEGGVVVAPFEPVTEIQGNNWIGRAIQQNLLMELGRGKLWTAAGTAKAVKDAEQAKQAGQDGRAAYVVYGSYQVVDSSLRITGQILHLESNKIVGGLKTTGTMRDLFAMEDDIAEQARRILGREASRKTAEKNPPAPLTAATPTPTLEPSGPVTMGYTQDREPSLLEQVRRERYWDEFERSRYNYRYSYGPGYGYGPGYRYSGYLPDYYFGHRYYSSSSWRAGGVYVFPGGMMRLGN